MLGVMILCSWVCYMVSLFQAVPSCMIVSILWLISFNQCINGLGACLILFAFLKSLFFDDFSNFVEMTFFLLCPFFGLFAQAAKVSSYWSFTHFTFNKIYLLHCEGVVEVKFHRLFVYEPALLVFLHLTYI